MSRRRQPGELQFGSDSFLDVVANLVGILIILIVVAGLRVSKTPVVIKLPADSESSDTEDVPIPSSLPEHLELPEPAAPPETSKPVPEAPQIVMLEPVIDEPDEPEPPPPLPALEAPRELVNLATQLEGELGSIGDEEAGVEGNLKRAGELQSALKDRHRTFQSKLAEKNDQLTATKKQTQLVESDIVLARETLARLNKQVKELESIPVHVETLEHRITPISRTVDGTEKHYRLEKNRVIEVPIQELVTRFREQIERRKDWLAKTRQHKGEIGPMKGFIMHYRVRVDAMSDLDSWRAGRGGYQISLESWEVVPEADARGETEEVALRKGSDFYQSILGTSPDTTLTFWVYPDSYGLYQKLQKFTHDHGYSVAGRPLPFGIPIAGSPQGTKSASQ